MKRLFFAGLVGCGPAVGFAQQPPAGDPTPPLTPPSAAAQPVTPASATAPKRADTPLAAFDPLVAHPQTTQQALRAALHGSAWMTRMSQPQGRFAFGYLPAVRQPLDGDHDLKQAHAALALAQSARFTGDDRQAATASQAVLALLAATKIDPSDPTCRVPVKASVACNRVGFAAVLALAVYELPGADDRLLGEAEKLCAFLRKQLRENGSVHFADNPADDAAQVDPAGATEYPGYALHALAVSHRVRPAGWKRDAAKKGCDHYRAAFKAAPHPTLAATLTPALAELYAQTKGSETATTVFEMNDFLAGLQYPPGDGNNPLWAGGFRAWAGGKAADATPGCEAGAYLQSLACACQVTRLVPDLPRFARYKQAATDAAQFVCGIQYTEPNTRHFENTFRANVLIGGFYLAPADGTLRIDATARCVTGLLRFLTSGAEK
jgi:hypothetical protein